MWIEKSLEAGQDISNNYILIHIISIEITVHSIEVCVLLSKKNQAIEKYNFNGENRKHNKIHWSKRDNKTEIEPAAAAMQTFEMNE